MARERRKQDLLFLAEVHATIGIPVINETLPGIVCARLIGSLQTLRDHQRVVVVPGELLERWVSLHRFDDIESPA